MPRQRHQQGSLQVRSHGKRKMWVLLYRDGNIRRYVTLGPASKLTKSDAQKKRDLHMKEVAAKQQTAPDTHITFGAFVNDSALPFLLKKWKRSTADTTSARIQHHLVGAFATVPMRELSLQALQRFLHQKATSHSKSLVAHLRWDLHLLFKLAQAQAYVERDPTGALYTPKEARTKPARALRREEVRPYLAVLNLREQVIAHLAIFTGMRPGEILALQRINMAADCLSLTITQRVYRGVIDSPKTESSARTVAIPPKTAVLVREWMELVGDQPDAWLFASENATMPLWRDSVWYRNMKPKLKNIGLDWANFQELRRTHASLGHAAKIDPKVSADQRGHGIGVALGVYIKSSIEEKAEAAKDLEDSIFAA